MNHGTAQPDWQPAPPKLRLLEREIDLWRVPLAANNKTMSHLEALLDENEQARADKFRLARDRRRFIVGRGMLRALLGQYLSVPAGQVQFSYGPQGKPSLSNLSHPLYFNLAHSEELAVYAFTPSYAIGVDLEFIHPMPEMAAIARRYFSPGEQCALQAVPDAHKTEAFFQCWTRKEAFIKAVGKGLSYPLDQFEVSLGPGQEIRLLDIHTAPGDATKWGLVSFEPGENYVGALAIPGQDWLLRRYSASADDWG